MSGANEIAAQVAQAAQAAEAKKSAAGQSGKAQRAAKRKRAFPFKVEAGQLWREVEAEGESGAMVKRWVAFGTELNVIARTRSTLGEDHGLLLEVVDCDGLRHRWAMPAALMAGSGEGIRAELMRLGWSPVASAGRKWRDWLFEYLLTAQPEARARCVAGIGWHDAAFVLPDETIGAQAVQELAILQSEGRLDHAFNVAGDLRSWRETVALQALGNSRLVLAISAAFAAPLLALTGEDGGGFHLRGGSSSGKSTALAVAGSVWGGGGLRGYVQSWRTTDNALEAMAALHNGACLCLDELGQIDARTVGAAAYMLGNGIGKARSTREGQTRKSHEWRLIFLSSGELGLADKIKEGGGKVAAGMEVRVIDLRADAGAGLGLFEQVHEFADGGAFSQALKEAAGKNYGTPARAYLKALVADLESARRQITAQRQAFVREVLPMGADGQVKRVADRFALVAAAGELATRYGITGWGAGVATDAAARGFADWLTERGGHGSGEVAEARGRILQAIETDGHARFLPWYPDPRTVLRMNALGYVKRADEAQPDRPPSFYFHASGMAEIMAGLDRKTVLEALGDAGVIVRHVVKGANELNKAFKVPYEGATKRLYQIDYLALMGFEEAEG